MILVTTDGGDMYMGLDADSIRQHIQREIGENENVGDLTEVCPFSAPMVLDNGKRTVVAEAMVEQILLRPLLIPVCIASENC